MAQLARGVCRLIGTWIPTTSSSSSFSRSPCTLFFPRMQVGDEVLHIELRRWADVMVLAPLSANSLAKVHAEGGGQVGFSDAPLSKAPLSKATLIKLLGSAVGHRQRRLRSLGPMLFDLPLSSPQRVAGLMFTMPP